MKKENQRKDKSDPQEEEERIKQRMKTMLKKSHLSEGEETEDLEESLNILKRLYRFIQLFCEGHNRELQNHLREQKTTTGAPIQKDYDFIKKTSFYFYTLIKSVNRDSLDVATQMLDFLIESVQGPCLGNQKAQVEAKMINTCMDFLTFFHDDYYYRKRGFFTDKDRKEADNATTKAMKLLNSLIEANDNEDIIKEMCNTIDFKFLARKVSDEYVNLVTSLKLKPDEMSPEDVTNRLTGDSFTQEVLESFDVYILMATLADRDDRVREALKAFMSEEHEQPIETKALNFMRMNTGNVEIYFEGRLLKIYFPIYPICRNLTEDSQKKLI
mmetsp:Transcript_28121/g.24853  ORF Transcript_28121/g.24853 Transcript_28121/m.24853 type:complete len:328 (+) Transcript_28121:955-1938(+)